MSFDLGNLLQQYASNNPATPDQAVDDFDRVAASAPSEQLAQGVSQAFRSDDTPPFPQMLGNLFGNSNSGQQAGMLNQLIGSIGPGVLASLAGGVLGNILGGDRQAPAAPQITPEQASQLSPQQVQDIAAQAEQDNPGIVDRMGAFYAQHPQLVKGLGGAALAIALGHMAQGMRRN
ncbi:hypothetical protein [Massilia sp. DWR3-1-1]|uniref:hypothetical protein n=1 Tax=Massilia sp. DWR3-1-1 TaxID=2804559 RepID=UPI003CF1035E